MLTWHIPLPIINPYIPLNYTGKRNVSPLETLNIGAVAKERLCRLRFEQTFEGLTRNRFDCTRTLICLPLIDSIWGRNMFPLTSLIRGNAATVSTVYFVY